MARRKNETDEQYKARTRREYQARNARSQQRYGVPYTQQRRVREAVDFPKELTDRFLADIVDAVDFSGFGDVAQQVTDLIDINREGDRSFEWIIEQLADLGIDIDPDNIPEWLWYDD